MIMQKRMFGFVTDKGKFVSATLAGSYAVKSGSKQLDPDAFNKTDYGQRGLINPLYQPSYLTNLLEINAYHTRCCKAKARDTAGLGYELRPIVEEGREPSEDQRKRLDDFFSGLSQPLSIVLDRGSFDFESMGYGSLEIVRDDRSGEIIDMVHLPSHTLRVHKSRNKYCQVRNNKRRWFKRIGYEQDIDMDTGDEFPENSLDVEKRATEVIYWLNYTPKSDYYGMPDGIPAIRAMYGDISRADYNISFFDNFGVPAYAVLISGDFDPGEEVLHEDGSSTGQTELEAAIEAHFQELAKNPHSVLVLTVPTRKESNSGDVKIQFEPLAVTVKEASFRLYRKDNRDEVLSAHGVPPYRAGIAETGSLGGSTAKESTEIYKASIIKPRQEILEALINQFIVWEDMEITDWEFRLAEIDTADEAHDMEMCGKLMDKAAMTPNQLIRHFKDRFGLEESDHPAMDAYYLDGKVITPVEPDSKIEEIEPILKSLQAKLLEVVVKDARYCSEDGDRDREIFDVLKSIEEHSRMAAGR